MSAVRRRAAPAAAKQPIDERQVEALVAELRDVGFAILPGLLPPAIQRGLRRRLYRLLAAERERNLRPSGHQRVLHLAPKDPYFLLTVCHPLVLAVWRRYLGEDMLCSSLSANALWPGSTEQYWHVDHPYWTIAPPYPVDLPLGGQAIWMIDDFTVENGATAGIPGSHRRPRLPDLEGRWSDEAAIFTSPRGSVALMDGALWHTSRPNATAACRGAILVKYIRSFCVTQEDMRAQLAALENPPALVQQLFGTGQYVPTRSFPY